MSEHDFFPIIKMRQFQVNQRSTKRQRTGKSKTKTIPKVKELNPISNQKSLMPFFHHVDKMEDTYIQNHENEIISGSEIESFIYILPR